KKGRRMKRAHTLGLALTLTVLGTSTARAELSPSSASLAHAVSVAFDDPTIITLKHWSRILDGELFAMSSRVDWAVLLQRTFGKGALRCPQCDAKMRVIATSHRTGGGEKDSALPRRANRFRCPEREHVTQPGKRAS